jgi:hypothetical protein
LKEKATVKIRVLLLLLLGLVIALCGPPTVNASVTWVVLTQDNVSDGDGGEFLVSVYSSGAFDLSTGAPSPNLSLYLVPGASFHTFCASKVLEFYPGDAYEAGALTPATGLDGTLGGAVFSAYWSNDPPLASSSLPLISPPSGGYVPGHDALYGNKILSGYSNTDIAGAIQDEVWTSLAEESGFQFGTTSGVAAALGWSQIGYTGETYGIQTFGLIQPPDAPYWLDESEGQPQLYITSANPFDGSTPEPATIVVWSLLGAVTWLGMRFWRRRAA